MTDMGKRNSENIAANIQHQQRIIDTLLQQIRHQEIVRIQHGLNAPMALVNEINAYKRELYEAEETLAQLESQFVEDKFSVAEAEYRLLVAECWSEGQGYPSVIGLQKLELARLRLRISVDRATEMEKEIRILLVDEIFRQIGTDDLKHIYSTTGMKFPNQALLNLAVMVRLDMIAAIDRFTALIETDGHHIDPARFKEYFFRANRISNSSPDFQLFNQFIIELYHSIPHKLQDTR